MPALDPAPSRIQLRRGVEHPRGHGSHRGQRRRHVVSACDHQRRGGAAAGLRPHQLGTPGCGGGVRCPAQPPRHRARAAVPQAPPGPAFAGLGVRPEGLPEQPQPPRRPLRDTPLRLGPRPLPPRLGRARRRSRAEPPQRQRQRQPGGERGHRRMGPAGGGRPRRPARSRRSKSAAPRGRRTLGAAPVLGGSGAALGRAGHGVRRTLLPLGAARRAVAYAAGHRAASGLRRRWRCRLYPGRAALHRRRALLRQRRRLGTLVRGGLRELLGLLGDGADGVPHLARRGSRPARLGLGWRLHTLRAQRLAGARAPRAGAHPQHEHGGSGGD
mmetsp:Transcript_55359/g.160411  ORF Transcript_55359/g.160411 Transcript_55359/m.160411 type:complete len:328 (-) Transcript_55359:1710-2693(-)